MKNLKFLIAKNCRNYAELYITMADIVNIISIVTRGPLRRSHAASLDAVGGDLNGSGHVAERARND
ncbi:hypothetical protein PR048_014256 [Dryococelus australis]|uniref:Uncharacterized protein n=1 Tax=Dryococelus australis TaxID=614101 RepID=A0ABQ9HDQ7_9NEOP|nr:hypothetical protein PR048_014256 [Dryococelus australis]